MERLATKEANQRLSELRKKYQEVMALTIKDLSSEINSRRTRAYEEEMMYISEEYDCLEDIMDAAMSTSMDDLVISEEEVFDDIIDGKVTEINGERYLIIQGVLAGAPRGIEAAIDKNWKIVYEFERYRSRSYSKVYRHYLKHSNPAPARGSLFIPREKYDRQRDILARILNVHVSGQTIAILDRYRFLDRTFRDVIRRFHLNTLNFTHADKPGAYCLIEWGAEIKSNLRAMFGEEGMKKHRGIHYPFGYSSTGTNAA